MRITKYKESTGLDYLNILAQDGPEHFCELMECLSEQDVSWIQPIYTSKKIKQELLRHATAIRHGSNQTGCIDHLRETGASFPLSSMTSAPVLLLDKNGIPSPHTVYISSTAQAKNISYLSKISSPRFSCAFKEVGAKDFRDITPVDIGKLMSQAPNEKAKLKILDMVIGIVASSSLLLDWSIPNLASPQLPKRTRQYPKPKNLAR